MQREFLPIPPMPSDIASILLGFPRLAADVISDHPVVRLLSRHSPLAYHHTDSQSAVLPQSLIPKAAGAFDREVLAVLPAARGNIALPSPVVACSYPRRPPCPTRRRSRPERLPSVAPDCPSRPIPNARRLPGPCGLCRFCSSPSHQWSRRPPQRSSNSNSRGIAVISFDLSLTACLAKGQMVGCRPGTHQVQGRLPPPTRSCDRRTVLPSMAICFTPRVVAKACIQPRRHDWKAGPA